MSIKTATASADDGDFTAISMLLSFISGSTDGDRVCVNITVFSDLLVECEEDFTVMLTLNTIEDNLLLENNSTFVTLMDNDGTYVNSIQ